MILTDIGLLKDVKIKNLSVNGLMRERLLSLGFTKGSTIKKIKSGKKNSIAIYLIKDVMIALRKEETNKILVEYE